MNGPLPLHRCPDCNLAVARVYAKDGLLVCRHCLEVREGIEQMFTEGQP